MAEKYVCAHCGKEQNGEYSEVDQHTGMVFCKRKVPDRVAKRRHLGSMSCA